MYKKIIVIILAVFCSYVYFTGCGDVVSMLLARLSVESHELIFEAVQDEDDPALQSVEVECLYTVDGQDEDCDMTATADQTWLEIEPTELSGSDRLAVAVNIQGLAAGTYEGNIHVETDISLVDNEEDITVTLIVSEPAL